ncbi:MAG: polyprenyl synthetase family protein [Oscillospiraceae bacterium]|nr:polyprenyl synthetase family protein [Oscillospiraceae bacterium]
MEQQLHEYKELIEKELETALYCPENFKVVEAMRYSTLGGGKRIRGALVLEFCRVFGGNVNTALCVAGAIEMLQAFSLIHDDLPCMDDDDFRRGKPSCHKQFGEAEALLAGDALLANAFNSAAASIFLPKSEGLKPQNAVSVISTLSNATFEMIKGQQLDMDFEGIAPEKISEDELIGMYNRKTCALISAACVCGAICADTSDKNLHLARGYGVALGLAFQIADDLLDFESEKTGKKTYPVLFGKKKAVEKSREYTDTAVKIAGKLREGEFLRELAITLNKREV